MLSFSIRHALATPSTYLDYSTAKHISLLKVCRISWFIK
jgi:hypothetical protein